MWSLLSIQALQKAQDVLTNSLVCLFSSHLRIPFLFLEHQSLSQGKMTRIEDLNLVTEMTPWMMTAPISKDTFMHPFSFLFSLILKSCWLSLQCYQASRRALKKWENLEQFLGCLALLERAFLDVTTRIALQPSKPSVLMWPLGPSV
ncbi:uncharacterized protein LOC132163438 [Corylus avellana]|uniref:uncharacterized protein LOC132163225 n=1 Tax=Corylus avellana TaxID=13451 RepID=UPI00286B35A7|nr:uncharacterized protein LOC132163225 [Corylus avellana]XP_059429716.1 uncharacterized protein LOC132163438 [Corylus avellana]